MQAFFDQIFGLIINSPGNLIYHLTVAFAITAGLQNVLLLRRATPSHGANRMALGFGMLLLGQVLLFVSTGLVWQKLAESQSFLPPLERAIATFSLLWGIWLWAFPRPNRAVDILHGLLNLAVVIFFLFNLTLWVQQYPNLDFNLTWLDWSWQIACLVLIAIGLFTLLLKRPAVWGMGLGFLGINLAGIVVHLLGLAPNGDYPASVRLAQLCAYPLLPLLAQRIQTTLEVSPKAELPHYPGTERRRHTADPRAVYAWLQLACESNPQKLSAGVTRAIAQTMLSDLCFLITPPSAQGEIIIHSGYDLIREEELPGASLEANRIPVIAAAVQRGRPLRLLCNGSIPPDVKTIGEAIGLENAGNLLLIPLMHAQKVWGGLLMLSPYSNRAWNLDDQGYLGSSTDLIIQLLQDGDGQLRTQKELQTTTQELSHARSELDALRMANQTLSEQLDQLENAPIPTENEVPAAPSAAELQASAAETHLEELLTLQKELHEAVSRLQSENDALRAQLQTLKTRKPGLFDESQSDTSNGELRLALEEVVHLQNALGQAKGRIHELELVLSSPGTFRGETAEVIASIAQDLRQPMSSIIGYTDLILSESVGILGALQRKFLERVKTSTETMRALLDDLIQTTSLEGGHFQLLPQPVDLDKAIDHCINDTSAQMRERSITLRVDLPDDLPRIHTDQDALQQILIHLLQNAAAVTPREGTITLRGSVRHEPDQPYLQIQVVDMGGGIAPEDLPRVFARRYRADNPLIQGVGDTGVGLSITKTLVEAMDGRIWVESQNGQTSTFSVLLPTHPDMGEETAA